MKTEVYSWRVSADLKAELEREARRQNQSVSRVLDLAARGWLKKQASKSDDKDEQARLHAIASRFFGRLEGAEVHRSENVTHDVRRRLRQRHGR